MPFPNAALLSKQTFTPRPTIPTNKQLKSAEFVEFVQAVSDNYQEFLDLSAVVAALAPQPYIRVDTNTTITEAGIYLFFGSAARTFTIQDGIVGQVEIRTIATAQLNLTGNINSNHIGIIYEGTPVTLFRWDAITNQYTF
jgi:hypothetical protein